MSHYRFQIKTCIKSLIINQLTFLAVLLSLPFYSNAQNTCQNLFLDDILNSKSQSQNVPTIHFEGTNHSLSKTLRSNAPFFWNFFKKMNESLNNGTIKIKGVSQKFINKISSFTGIIVGDAHLGNIHLLPHLFKKFKEMLVKNIDLDDGGIGNYIYDFIHLALSIKSISKEVDLDSIIEGYLKGLKGDEIEPPKFIQKFLEMSNKDYEILREEHVNKKVNNDQFIKSDELKDFDNNELKLSKTNVIRQITFALKLSYPKDFEILDLALLPVTSGGSAHTGSGDAISLGTTRIWALIKIEGKNHIFELKPQSNEPAVSQMMDQNYSREMLWEKLREFFGYINSDLALLELNQQIYYLREKKVTLFDVPYTLKSKKDLKRLKELSYWGAYHLGRWHRQNENGKEYSDFLNKSKNYDPFKKFVQFSRDKFFKEIETRTAKE